MTELFRLRLVSTALRAVLCCSLLSVPAVLIAADYPHSAIHHRVKKTSSQSRSKNATTALFDQNDAARAYKLAQRNLALNPRDVNAWFVSMEAAHLLEDQAAELRSVLSVCARARQDDSRANIAAMRLAALGQNSAPFRQRREAIERLASRDSVCSPAAREALYQASLDGLQPTNPRELAQRSGWLTAWTISRGSGTNSKAQPEQFEFADAHIRLPEYFSPASAYTAESTYEASEPGNYMISGEHDGVKLAVDGHEVTERVLYLSAGTHQVRLTFRGTDRAPRVRLLRSTEALDSNRRAGHGSRREEDYVRAAAQLAAGNPEDAIDLIRTSDLATTVVGLRLLQDATPVSAQPIATTPLPLSVVLAHPTCDNVTAAIDLRTNRESQPMLEQRLQSCAPDSLVYAQWLAAKGRELDTIGELHRLLQQWPLDRQAHRLLIGELQRIGNNQAADRAAAELLAIAPNARNFRRMAQNASMAHDGASPFYEPYRRITPAALPETAVPTAPVVILLQDKVAISRADGSVSMYMHRVVQLMTDSGAQMYRPLPMPGGAQLLTSRIVNRVAAAALPLGAPSALRAGDEIEEEYVVNFTGDGGMISHPEAFQYVFNDFDSPLLDARFIVLSPSNESAGYVIASGEVPSSRTEFANGYRAEMWERKMESAGVSTSSPGIIRVVENENGWSIPPSVERRRILETIHPGPRPREA